MVTIQTNNEKKLTPNNEQKQCIENINGKYLVLAGPGTGKTFTVISRIKAMLDNGINPEKILCLTYSEAAAGEMNKKLIEAFGKATVNVNIYTYHSFCNEIISENAEYFELPDNYRVINDTIKKQFIKECIDEFDTKAYRNSKNDPYVFFKTISDQFEEIKKYRMTKEEYFHNIETNPDFQPTLEALKNKREDLLNKKDKNKNDEKFLNNSYYQNLEKIELKIAKAKEIWELYELYKSKMERENYIDFDDMIGFVLDKFESDSVFLDNIANKYDYIMVDEYQDTNNSQNKIVFNLVKALKSQNIFVVGDDDQIIYSFQGANLDTIEGFLKKFQDTQVVCLKENMRSTQSILDVARLIAKQDDRRLEINPEFAKYNIDKSLIAKNKDVIAKDKKVRLTVYQDQFQEYTEIIKEIEELINSDDCPKDKDGNKKYSEIAVIITSNPQIAVIAEMFKDKGIPVELKDGNSIFKIKSSITLYYYLQMLANPELYCDKILKLLLLPPFKINPIDFAKIHERIAIDNKTFIDSMKEITDWVDENKIKNFLDTYEYLQEFSAGETVRNIVLEVGAKTGIFNFFLNEEINKLENILGLQKIVNEAENFSDIHQGISLEEFVDYLITIQNDIDLDIRTDKPPVQLNAIQLTTYHSSKGKEYEYVYMPSLQASSWESSPSSLKPSIPVSLSQYKDTDTWKTYKKSDKVKTMYVGMTRAKHTLRLSYNISGGKTAGKPSQWILDAADLMDVVKAEDYSLENYSSLVVKALTTNDYDYKRDFEENIKNKIKDKTYSPTAINNYISCPRKYLYNNILKLNTRTGYADYASYGSAVHDTLQDVLAQAMKNNIYPTKEEVIEKFKTHLSKLPFSSVEQRKIFLERGEKELSEYYHHITDTPIANIYGVEKEINIEIDGVKFYGKADKIEKNDDGTYTIIDYKTTKALTQNDICPASTHFDYYNQICLYKYYFEKQNNAVVRDVKFVFPIDSSVLLLTPTNEECQAVVDNFKNSITKISNCEFEPTPSEKSCKYCAYNDFCMMNAV